MGYIKKAGTKLSELWRWIAQCGEAFISLFSKEKGRLFLKQHLFNPDHSPQLKALSIGFGVFMGIVPIWGFQLLVAFSLAMLFRLNKALVLLAAHISFAPMIPVIIFLSYKVGGLWVGDKAEMPFDGNLSLKSISLHLEQYLYGSISLAIVAGLASGLFTLALFKIIKKKPEPAL